MIIYGTKAVATGVEEYTLRCASCEAHTPSDVMVYSRYYHIYFIPMMPIGRETTIICKQCGLTRTGVPFNSSIFSNYHEIRSNFKHPIYLYAGVGLVGLLILGGVIGSLKHV